MGPGSAGSERFRPARQELGRSRACALRSGEGARGQRRASRGRARADLSSAHGTQTSAQRHEDGCAPFSTKWGTCRAKPDGWGVESRNTSSKARSLWSCKPPGFEAAGHTPSGPPGHLPQQAGEGSPCAIWSRLGTVLASPPPSRMMKTRGAKGSSPMTKAVLIFGCSTGIGRAAAHLFAARGFSVTATMRRTEDAGDLAAAENVRVEPLDVVDVASAERAVARTLEAFGTARRRGQQRRLWRPSGPFEPRHDADHPPPVRHQPVWPVRRHARRAAHVLRAQKSGVIVNVSPRSAASTTFPMNSLYHATKYAVVGFTEALNYELAPFGILAKVVCPGGVRNRFRRPFAGAYVPGRRGYGYDRSRGAFRSRAARRP